MNLSLGQIVPLSAQLTDGATTKYPIAKVFSNDGVELPESPITLAHVGNGLYQAYSFLMPNYAFITAQYFIYSDAGHTTIDADYPKYSDIFSLDNSNSDSSILNGIVASEQTLNGIVTSGDLFAEVEDC